MNKFLLVLSLSIAILSASPLKVGSALNELNDFKYETPQGKELKVPEQAKLIIIAFEKDTGRLVNEYLGTKEPKYLDKHSSIYIADIHKMPTIITYMFALPKLKKHKHLIYLQYEDEFSTVVPSKEEQVTLLHVKDGKIESISYISTKEELQKAIEE